MSRGMDELYEDEEKPDTSNKGHAASDEERPYSKWTKKELEKVIGDVFRERKEPITYYMGPEAQKALDKAIIDLIKKDLTSK